MPCANTHSPARCAFCQHSASKVCHVPTFSQQGVPCANTHSQQGVQCANTHSQQGVPCANSQCPAGCAMCQLSKPSRVCHMPILKAQQGVPCTVPTLKAQQGAPCANETKPNRVYHVSVKQRPGRDTTRCRMYDMVIDI